MKKDQLILLVLFLSVVAGLYCAPLLPDTMITHWGIDGTPDGYGGKMLALSISPVLILLMFVLHKVLPKIDPLRNNIESFRQSYDNLFLALTIFFFYLHALVIIANLGVAVNMSQAMPPALGFLMYAIALTLRDSKPNWFVGIRTPWTMGSVENWRRTHALGYKLFTAAAIICVLAAFVQQISFALAIGAVLLAAFVPIAYSYVLYSKSSR